MSLAKIFIIYFTLGFARNGFSMIYHYPQMYANNNNNTNRATEDQLLETIYYLHIVSTYYYAVPLFSRFRVRLL